MHVLNFTLLTLAGALLAGLVGSLTGLGGGVILVPLLTLGLGVDIRYAIGASLVCVIATSSGAAAAFVKEGFTNIRVGMFLEIATTVGALLGTVVAVYVSSSTLAVIFGIVLIFSAAQSMRPRVEHITMTEPGTLGDRLRLASTFPHEGADVSYGVEHVPAGFAMMFVAGILSALLGIGSGVVKVLAMDRAMHLPYKVSTTTSNFMIGVTAAASAGVYLHRGYIDPVLVMPVVLGVLAGATIGARLLARVQVKPLRLLFTVVMVALACEMLFQGLTKRI
ncbi:MAG: sulfite exporter TauE/SafE family protein [Gemmatimonadota bacterium]|nr:sulfite exporter TauE/SafE family protein [Gemmatimonadota bacterium]